MIDERLAIFSDRNCIIQKMDLENKNMKWNEYLDEVRGLKW